MTMGQLVADAVAALPAGILATIAILTLLAGRVWKSDSLPPALCGIALALAAAAMGFAKMAPAELSPNELTGRESTALPAEIANSSAASARHYLIDDRLSRSAAWLALGLGFLAALTACDCQCSPAGRRFAILLFSVAGVLLAASANNLFVVVLAMELAALPATVLLFVEGEPRYARAAAMRSLALNIFAFAALLAGALLIGSLVGSSNLEDLRALVPHALAPRPVRLMTTASPITGAIGCVLLLAGFGVHFLAAPFQLAAGEILDGATFWGIGLTALFPRGAALLLMIRVLVQGQPRLEGTAQTLFTAVGFLTLLIGGLLAFAQTRIRRLLAFTLVFESGLILAALAAACCERVRPAATPWLGTETPGGVGAACLCFAIDSLALVGLLALVASRWRSNRPMDDVEQVAAALRGNKLIAAAVSILTASLAGVPPFAGFWPRVAILQSTLSISVPAENGFLPHQNVDYVIVVLAAGGGLILLAVVSFGFFKRVLLDDWVTPHVEILQPGRSASAAASTRLAVAVGLLASLTIVALGIVSRPAVRLAARETADERVLSQTSVDESFSPRTKNAIRRRSQQQDAEEQ